MNLCASSPFVVRLVAAVLLLFAGAGTAQAQQGAAPTVRSLTFIGVQAVPVSALQQAGAEFVGAPATATTLAALRQRVQQVYTARGLSLVSVLPPALLPDSEGLVLVRVNELKVSLVEVIGAKDRRALSRLPALAPGQAPQFEALTRQLFLFNDNPRRKAALDFTPGADEALTARVTITEQAPTYGSVVVDNTGSRQTGEGRLRLSAGHADLLGRGMVGEAQITTSFDGRTVRQGLGRLSVPLLSTGGTVDFSLDHSRSELGSVLAFNSISGRSTGVQLGYRHALLRASDRERFLTVGLNQRQYDDVYDFAGINLGSSVATRPLTLGYSALARGRWVTQVSLGLTGNIPGGGDNARANYAASRFGATPQWLRGNASAFALRPLGAGWQLSARLQGQYSGDALISGEQFRTGGSGGLRGLIEGEVAGDSGLGGGVELTSAWPLPLQSFVFAEATHAHRNRAVVGSPTTLAATTAGFGLRSPGENRLGFELSVGEVLSEKNLPQSEAGDRRVHASARFNF